MTLERSEKQKEASRENGKLSRGPVTPEGKARSSQNSIRHGLCARLVVLKNERKQNYTALLRKFRNRFAPKDEFEESLIEEITNATWRLHRAWGLETSMINQALAPPPDPRDNNFAEQMVRTCESLDKALAKTTFAHLMHHEAKLQLSVTRSLRNFRLARGIERPAMKNQTDKPGATPKDESQQLISQQSDNEDLAA